MLFFDLHHKLSPQLSSSLRSIFVTLSPTCEFQQNDMIMQQDQTTHKPTNPTTHPTDIQTTSTIVWMLALHLSQLMTIVTLWSFKVSLKHIFPTYNQ